MWSLSVSAFPKEDLCSIQGLAHRKMVMQLSVNFALDTYFYDFVLDTSSHFILLPGDHLFLPWYAKAYFHLSSYLHPFITLIAAGGLYIGDWIWKHRCSFSFLGGAVILKLFSTLHSRGKYKAIVQRKTRQKLLNINTHSFHYFLDQHAVLKRWVRWR